MTAGSSTDSPAATSRTARISSSAGESLRTKPAAPERIASKIEAHSKRFYLLSYCTPARKGQHVVRIEVDTDKVEGKGFLEYTFDADGFGPPPHCDPERKPTFKLDAVEQPEKAK